MTKQATSWLTKAILETANGMHRAGIMDDAVHAKITLRHLGKPVGAVKPSSAEDTPETLQSAASLVSRESGWN